jgi:hypothetical protein
VRRLAVSLLLAACSGGGAATQAGPGGAGSQAPGFGGAGPWGSDNRRYGPADGILEQPVVGASTDEAQNLWVATHDALYLLKPGDKTFRRFDARDGLHLQSNPVQYCDADFGDRACPISGAASDPGISEIEGGAAGEVFVGYFGIDDGSDDWTDPNRHSGKLDRVRLSSNGLQVDRFDLSSSNTAQFWHNRTVQRLVYDHFQHPHELYVGTNHGVDRLWPDKYRAPAKGEWFLKAESEWMSDHLHPQVCFHHACDASESDLRLGDWKGLALSKDGNLWVGGRWTAGQIRWTQDLPSWWNSVGRNQLPLLRSGARRRPGRIGRARHGRAVGRTPGAGGNVQRPRLLEPADRRAHLAARGRGPPRRSRLPARAGPDGLAAHALRLDLGGRGRPQEAPMKRPIRIRWIKGPRGLTALWL